MINADTPAKAAPLGFLLHDVARLLRKRFEQKAKTHGLTRSQWQAIAYLARNEGISQGGLAELMDVEPITMGRILDRLADRKLVERRQHPTDRRIWQLYLEEGARPLLEAIEPLGEETRAEALNGLTPAQRADLLAALGLMKSNLIAACRAPICDKEKTYG